MACALLNLKRGWRENSEFTLLHQRPVVTRRCAWASKGLATRFKSPSMSLWLSIGLISLCAVCWDIGVVLQKRAADVLPPLRVGTGLWSSIKAVATSGPWVLGLVMSAAGWGLFAWALDSTPVSLARAIQGSGLVILALFSRLFLNHRLRVAEWLAVAGVTLGIVALGLSEPVDQPTKTQLVPFPFAVGLLISLLITAGLMLKASQLGLALGLAPVFSAAAGLLLGLGDVLTKAVLVSLEAGQRVLTFAVLGPLLVAVYIGGLLLLSRSYQHGRAIVVTAVSDTAARLVAIFLGVMALGEQVPADVRHGTLRVLGLLFVLSGTVFLSRFSGEELARVSESGKAKP